MSCVCAVSLGGVVVLLLPGCGLYFFKQKTAYEMRIRDLSSDVCSSDLFPAARRRPMYRPSRAKDGFVIIAAVSNYNFDNLFVAIGHQIGRASCRERVCQYV